MDWNETFRTAGYRLTLLLCLAAPMVGALMAQTGAVRIWLRANESTP
jgi:hypothetical protein